MDNIEIKPDPRSKRRAIEDKYHQKVLQDKKYYCESCNIAYMSMTILMNHFNSMKHNPNRYVSYKCIDCDYYTKNKSYFNMHLNTKKHKNTLNK